MRIGIDATPVWGPPVGHYTYMAHLVRSLLRTNSAHAFTVFCRRQVPDEFQEFAARADFSVCPLKNRKLCEQFWIPGAARTAAIDLYHGCWAHPYLYKGKSVVTIHGIEWYTHPDVPLHSGFNKFYYKHTIAHTCRRARRLIAISRFIKDSFIEHMGVPEDRIDIVYHGVDTAVYRRIEDRAALDAVRSKYKLPERFVLFVGAMVANKNLRRLIEAFRAVLREPGLADTALVIAGGQAWNSGPLLELVHEQGVEKNVVFTGSVSRDDIVALYNLATVYAFPSLVEGFGLPVLEAFACGTAVLTSSVTAMAEVGADAALLVNPLDTDALADGLRRLLGDDRLRADLVQKGLRRASEFTWARTAAQTLAVYEKAMRQD